MKQTLQNIKLVVIVGPTSSGKSDLAVDIAKKFSGEIVSADSRQVYKGMNIGTGKITKKEMRGIPHHLLDVADPKKSYSVSQFKRAAHKAIHDIHKRNKLPILCGGTGFYIQAVVDNLILPEVKPNAKLRKELEKFSTEKLFQRLKRLDPIRAKSIDPHNPHRLVRAIEIATALGHVPHFETQPQSDFEVLQIGIKTDDDILKKRIHARLLKRVRRGMIAEAQHLHEQGVSWKRMENLGLEYKYLALHLQGKLEKKAMLTELETATWQYVKRQKTWFQKDPRITWITREQISDVFRMIESFLKK